MAWIYLIIAALFETAWTFSVKYLQFSRFRLLTRANVYSAEGFYTIGPLAGYIAFGIANVYFFSLAIKQVATPTAFAVWTALTLVFIKVFETCIFKQPVLWTEAFFMTLIMIGIIGLKVSAV